MHPVRERRRVGYVGVHREHDREVDGDFERAGSRASFRYRRRDDATRRFVSKRWGKIRRGDERELLRGDGVRKRGKEK